MSVLQAWINILKNALSLYSQAVKGRSFRNKSSVGIVYGKMFPKASSVKELKMNQCGRLVSPLHCQLS